MPRGRRGCRLKSNGPRNTSYADRVGDMADARIRLRVSNACGSKSSHKYRGKDGSHVQRVEMKWFLNVCMALSARNVR